MVTTMADKKQNKAAKLKALKSSFAKELPSKLSAIKKMWNGGEVVDITELHLLLHSLSGSAGTFGFIHLGEAALEMEQLTLQRKASASGAQTKAMFEQALQRLSEIAEKGPDNAMTVAIKTENNLNDEEHPLIYVLEDDVNLAKEIEQQLKHFGYQVKSFYDTKTLEQGVNNLLPDVLIADIQLPEGALAGPGVVAKLRKKVSKDLPVIFLSGHNTWTNRLNAVRAGSNAYLTKPVDFGSLTEKLDSITGREQKSKYRILIVEDTPLLAEHYAAVLENAGMDTAVINNPENILEILNTFNPDLILMDIYMPNCSGIEAAQVVRQHSAYINTPVVYLSTENVLYKQLQALQVGGDEFLQKPIEDFHLVEAVRIRAHRFRELSELMNLDCLTHLLNHINLKLALEREISLAQRREAELTFVMIDLDNFKSVNDKYGHPVGDQVIKSLARLLIQRLRKGDIAARYGGEEFAVILPDTTAENAYHLLDSIREQFSKISFRSENDDFNVTLSAGIAACSPTSDMKSLIVKADKALYQAKDNGRNQLVIAGVQGSKR